MMTHGRYAGSSSGVQRADVSFGEYISASVYFKPSRGSLPVALWLHLLSYDSGFNEGYIESESQTAVYYALAEAGFAVIAWDAAAFGTRGHEFNGAAGGPQGGNGLPLFYRRYPRWSLLGKIVHDGLSALDLATSGQKEFPGADPPIGLPKFDTGRVYAVGYDIGGRVALYMAALDDSRRLRGVVSINGWTPMRTDTNSSSTGGIRRLWDWHALQPVLGFYDGREKQLPYDMEDVMAESAVPTLIYQQDLDRTVDAAAVAATVARANSAGANVTLITAPTVNMLNDAAHEAAIAWLKRQAGTEEKWPSSGPPDAYANIGLVDCVSTGDGPGQPCALSWAENATDGTLRESRWHDALTISCAQASERGELSQCGNLQVDESIALSVLRVGPGATTWNWTMNLKWHVTEAGFVQGARGKCLSPVADLSDPLGRSLVASSNCGAAQRWDHLSDGRLRHSQRKQCVGIW